MKSRFAFWRSDPKDVEGLKDAHLRLAKATVLADDLHEEGRRNNFGRTFQDALSPRHRKV
jgi:hypothetical protein